MKEPPIGVVKTIFRYPVKGMRGAAMERAAVGWNGLDGDRRYAFVNPADTRSGRPYLTGRKAPGLVLYTPRIANPEGSKQPGVQVETPDSRTLPLEGQAMLAEIETLFGTPAQLLNINRGIFDAMPVSMISANSIQALGETIGMNLDPRRFRPNLVIEVIESQIALEDSWLGRQLVIGSGEHPVILRINKRNTRCAVITLDPDTGRAEPAVLKAAARERSGQVGVYATTEQPGEIRAGDELRLIPAG